MTADPIVEDFARRFPDPFAQSLAKRSPEETVPVLESLPAALAARIAVALPPSRFGPVTMLDSARLLEWLEQADVHTGIALITRLGRTRGLELVDALENQSLKRRLARAVRYPPHCVGARTTTDVMRVSSDASVADVLTELRSSEHSEAVRAVVLDPQGAYRGVLDLWQVLLDERATGRVRQFTLPVPALRAETSLSDAGKAIQWRDHLWLPVVDFNDRVLGAISKAALASAAAEPDEPLIDSALTLSQDFIQVSSSLLGTLLRGWSRQ